MANQRLIVLAVDDSVFDLKRIAAMLADRYEVRLSSKVDKAFAAMRNEHIDVLLLDVKMPEMSGIEFLAEARREDILKDTKVIFTTAYSESDTVESALDLDAHAYLVKPIDSERLIAKIEEVTGEAPS
jgi:CheY-like chemotaxis protein